MLHLGAAQACRQNNERLRSVKNGTGCPSRLPRLGHSIDQKLSAWSAGLRRSTPGAERRSRASFRPGRWPSARADDPQEHHRGRGVALSGGRACRKRGVGKLAGPDRGGGAASRRIPAGGGDHAPRLVAGLGDLDDAGRGARSAGRHALVQREHGALCDPSHPALLLDLLRTLLWRRLAPFRRSGPRPGEPPAGRPKGRRDRPSRT